MTLKLIVMLHQDCLAIVEIFSIWHAGIELVRLAVVPVIQLLYHVHIAEILLV